MPVEKPEQVRWLEGILQRPLHPLRRGKITDWDNRKCYEVDSAGRITGLNLRNCRISDGSFLAGLGQLTSLDLSHNQITDWSFLAGLGRLTALDLRDNEIWDGSFLAGLGRLTTLGLSHNQITDWSFLAGLAQLTTLDLSSNQISDGSFLAGLGRLATLNLSSNRISDWSFLAGLGRLTTLDLRDNLITDWSFLAGLGRLTALDLRDNQITDGSFLAGLGRLATLGLSSNRITDGSFLAGLGRLTALDLRDNQITDWSFLAGLDQLTTLDLRNNLITDGSFLAGLGRLTALDLGFNQITDGSFLAGLGRLTALDLSHNQITGWSFLAGLGRLTALDLSHNQIPGWSFLAGLGQLTTLDLGFNQISDGSFLAGLGQLTNLDLSHNQITDGSFLAGLGRLTTLDLRKNNLRELPPVLLELGVEIESRDTYLPHSINIHGNPVQKPPPEIIEQGHAAIVAWMSDALQGEKRLNEIKVILVGHGEAGKTTLRKRLTGRPPDPRESQTHGIEIHDHEFSRLPEPILVHFWDFGGQEILHATHQFFLSHRSLYILVLDGRKDEDADYWLKYIESFGGNSPILVALTKIDQNPGFEVNRKELRDRYRGIQDFFRVNGLNESDPEIARLVTTLPGHLAQVDMVRSIWPRSWFQVKRRLQQGDKPYLELHEFADICVRETITEEVKQKALIRYLNDLGIALHFEDERLNLLQVLNPRWATQAVYRIISDPDVARAHGRFTRARLPEILKKEKDTDFGYPREKHDYIIELMKKFELCYEFKRDQHLLPDLLDVQEPTFPFATRDLLRFRFEYDFLPRSILPRFIVRMHADIEQRGELVWRTGVVLRERDGKARAVVRSNNNSRWIAVEVEGPSRREYFAVIRHTFESIHDDFRKLAVKRKVPLYDNPAHAVDYDDLRFHEEKKRRTILIGELEKEYPVKNLLDGIEPPEARRARGRSGSRQVVVQEGGKYYEGHDMSDTFSTVIGDGNQNVNLAIGKNITQVTAEKIRNAFNRADEADRSEEVRTLLKQLAQEVARIVEKLPPDKAGELAEDLDTVSTQATAEKPVKKYWELSKQGIIDAAKAVGVVGETAIKLVTKLGPLLGFA